MAALPARPPQEWGRTESMMRQGICSEVDPGNRNPPNWEPTALGGNDTVRPLPRYVADAGHQATQAREAASSCNKQLKSGRRLSPGIFLIWCQGCSRCVLFQLMGDPESPRTPFNLLLTRWQRSPTQFQLDNGCNLHLFLKRREPEFFAPMRILIDEPHYRGHTNCSENYSTEHYAHVKNCSLAEQKNAVLRKLESTLANMSQPVAMIYLRTVLYGLNQEQQLSNIGESWMH